MDLRRLKEQASQLVAEGRYERAEVLYRQLLTGAPRDAGLWLKHAEVLKRLARVGPAVSSYRMTAQLLMGHGHLNRAVAALKIALELLPDDVDLVTDIIRYELRYRQKNRQAPAGPVEPVPTATELHALAENTPAPEPLLALPMYVASDSRISAMVGDVVTREREAERPMHRWPQVRRVASGQVAIKPSPSAPWIVLDSGADIEVRFLDEFQVPDEAPWLEEPG